MNQSSVSSSGSRNLFDTVWDQHTVGQLASGQTQLFIGQHLVHEVTSPQAFEMLRDRGLGVMCPERTLATVDHIIPTDDQARPFADGLAEEMMSAIERNCVEFGIELLGLDDPRQGIVHVVGPELGLTQPGITLVCGDSHTSTHGAFGAIALGIGTSQVAQVLATQTLAMNRPRVRRIEVTGSLADGVFAKDVILAIIRQLGVQGGVGFAYEYAGNVFDEMGMEERMTVCNMSIEGGARCGYVNPDSRTVEFLRGLPAVPEGEEFERAAAWWLSLASGPNATFDDHVTIDGTAIEPTVTWGINPGQSVGVGESIPAAGDYSIEDQAGVSEALEFMGLEAGQPIRGQSIDVAFICDVYHHFEYPSDSLASIWNALRPGGRLVVVDFIRIPGVSRPFVLGHVRAGEEVVTREIQEAGFEKIGEDRFLQENYILHFRKRF